MTESAENLYIKVLTIAANDGLPDLIHEQNNQIVPNRVFDELLNAGYLSGHHEEYQGGGGHFVNLKITLPGRQYLRQLTENITNPSSNTSINIIGDKNIIQNQSSQKITTQTATQTATITGILIKILAAVAAGLIVWYLTR